VREGLAGTKRECSCGRVVIVPPLHQLRSNAGLNAYNVSPELVIEQLLVAGRLPPDKACVQCGQDTDELLYIDTECEKAVVHTPGKVALPFVLLSLLFSPVWALLILVMQRDRGPQVEFGKDKIYALPLPVCHGCRGSLRNVSDIKESLCVVPEYRQLLEKFPHAIVRVRQG